MRYKNTEIGPVYSQPTMCLRCHLIVEMFQERDADPAKGAWQCPRCNRQYRFSHWKIKKQLAQKTKVAAENISVRPPNGALLLRRAFERHKARMTD